MLLNERSDCKYIPNVSRYCTMKGEESSRCRVSRMSQSKECH